MLLQRARRALLDGSRTREAGKCDEGFRSVRGLERQDVASVSRHQHDALRVPVVPGVGYTYNTPGLFAQDELAPLSWVKLAAAARVDSNNQYGTFVSPRLSALLRQPGSRVISTTPSASIPIRGPTRAQPSQISRVCQLR